MLSPNHARPQQSARRAYVCLSCRLHNPRHHFATTASDRSTSPSKAQNTSSRFAKPHLAALPSDQGVRRRILVNTDRHVLKFKKGQSWGQLVRGHYSKQETFTNPTERETNGSEGEREDRLELALAQHAAEPRRVTIHGREGKTEAVANTLRSGCVRIHKIEAPPARLSSSSPSMSHQTSSQFDSSRKRPTVYSTSRRDGLYKNSRAYHQQTVDSTPTANDLTPPLAASSIRAKLRQWQNDHGKAMEELYKDKMPLAEDFGAELNDSLTRLGDSSKVRRQVDDDRDEQHAIAHFARAQAEDLEDDVTDPRFLNMGDLVEIEYAMSEKDSTLAIYVRRMGGLGQFYTINGRWIHVPERTVQYSIPGWVSPELVKPLLDYLPDVEQLEDMDALQQEAYVNDLSVPRTVAGPLVSRLVAFNRESLEIYRKHASTLDRAHDILAHKEDLRYGSLVSAATTLLKTTSDKLPLTALFTVRKALMNAGFAFNVDRRSHRVTGYLQIRSKEQVRMVEEVRGWLREWQDDLAATSLMTSSQRQRHVPSKGAAAVNRFIEHAKAIVTASRQNREITTFGNIGPSKVKHEITEEQDAVKIQTDTRFNRTDTELVRFMEAWACSNMFLGLPRINALPPLILQATGLYEDLTLNAECGYIFLQELGTILPYENRVRFDQHLLLPSSQHSKPLQLLMNRVMDMRKEPDFSDSMKDIRYDWGGLPVYCIDGASAQEIDDGLSVQRANHADSVHPEWWVHVHIANPTAFFDRDHPLAKMARHMGETIYTPERTYMMLPRWATQRYFSLARDRPCLTFSARLNARGEVLENKIRAGTIRNVHRLTYEEVNQLVGLQRAQEQSAIDITVGGTPPPGKERVSAAPEMKQNNIDDLQTLQMLAERRQEVRKASGGVFFDSHRPEMTVWQSLRNNGLAWDHPHRKGARTVEGDPIINMKTEGLTNWFAAGDGVTDIMVREMMLLACNVSTEWCAQRQIPSIYRGSVAKPGVSDPAKFYEEVCQPAMAKNNGEMPLHIGVEYIKTQGSVILSTKPLRHNLLGLDHYGKVTSPLRRYGDMILHWQIEAALREEAKTGISLFGASTTLSGKGPDRSFLPFSSDALQAIMLGLQPREGMITRAKFYAEHFWIAMLMFRAHHFGEAKLPFETCHTYIATKPTPQTVNVMAIFEEINVACEMLRPERLGMGLTEARAGDRWECTLEEVNVFRRSISLRPVRLVSRWE